MKTDGCLKKVMLLAKWKFLVGLERYSIMFKKVMMIVMWVVEIRPEKSF